MAEQNAFTEVQGEDADYFPTDAPEAEAGKAFREFQLGKVEPTPENAVKVGLPHPDSQVIPESQEEPASSPEKAPAKSEPSLPKPVFHGIVDENH